MYGWCQQGAQLELRGENNYKHREKNTQDAGEMQRCFSPRWNGPPLCRRSSYREGSCYSVNDQTCVYWALNMHLSLQIEMNRTQFLPSGGSQLGAITDNLILSRTGFHGVAHEISSVERKETHEDTLRRQRWGGHVSRDHHLDIVLLGPGTRVWGNLFCMSWHRTLLPTRGVPEVWDEAAGLLAPPSQPSPPQGSIHTWIPAPTCHPLGKWQPWQFKNMPGSDLFPSILLSPTHWTFLGEEHHAGNLFIQGHLYSNFRLSKCFPLTGFLPSAVQGGVDSCHPHSLQGTSSGENTEAR